MALGEFGVVAQRALDEAERLGVVLDYVAVDQEAPAAVGVVHQQAVFLGVCEASRRRDAPLPEAAPEVNAGQALLLDEFYGGAYDRVRERLLIPAPRTVQLALKDRRPPRESVVSGPYVWTDAEDPDHAVWFFDHSAPTSGYAFMFTQPPHSLMNVSSAEIAAVFLSTDRHVLGEPTEESEIRSWDLDSSWAEYFRDGEDWWGTAAWTIRVSPTRVVAILASATE